MDNINKYRLEGNKENLTQIKMMDLGVLINQLNYQKKL